MPEFSERSKVILASCHPTLIRWAEELIKYFDFTVLEGFRDEENQNLAYAKGASQVRWPFGKHNRTPSVAVDIAPYPIDWTNKEAARQRFVLMAGMGLVVAKQLGISIRWGGDWDGDLDTRDERFRDLGHFELTEATHG